MAHDEFDILPPIVPHVLERQHANITKSVFILENNDILILTDRTINIPRRDYGFIAVYDNGIIQYYKLNEDIDGFNYNDNNLIHRKSINEFKKVVQLEGGSISLLKNKYLKLKAK